MNRVVWYDSRDDGRIRNGGRIKCENGDIRVAQTIFKRKNTCTEQKTARDGRRKRRQPFTNYHEQNYPPKFQSQAFDDLPIDAIDMYCTVSRCMAVPIEELRLVEHEA